MSHSITHITIAQILLRWQVGGFGSGIDPDLDDAHTVERRLYLSLKLNPIARDAMTAAGLVVFDANMICGKRVEVARLTDRAQKLAATLLGNAVEYVECDMAPACGDIVAISSDSDVCPGVEGEVDGIDVSGFLVNVDGELYEIDKEHVRLVRRAQTT